MGAWWIAAAIVALCVIVRFGLRARAGREAYADIEHIVTREGARTVIVGVHGWSPSLPMTRNLIEVAAKKVADADAVLLRYPATVISNINPIDAAHEVERTISDLSARYDRLILIGHSAGCLLLRKAYLFAVPGLGRDQPREGDAPPDATSSEGLVSPAYAIGPTSWRAAGSESGWWRKVDRFILFAGVNGGWDPAAKPVLRVAGWLGFLFGVGKLGRGIRRGTPFIENLRIDWVRLQNQAETMPPIVMIEGTHDVILDKRVNRDVMVGKSYLLINVPGATHPSVINVGRGDIEGGPTWPRRRALYDALAWQPDSNRQRGAPEIRSRRWTAQGKLEFVDRASADSATDAVLVLHGIRDRGYWSAKTLDALTTVADGVRFEQVAPRFGYFSMLLFILGFRNTNISWFSRAYTDILIDFPNVQRIHFWGHSYGTYIFGNALAEYESIRFHRAYLAGSVLPTRFSWIDFKREGRLDAICNVIGNMDVVVAVFPAMIERLREIVRDEGTGRRVGDAGFVGFLDDFVTERRAIPGGHGAFLNPPNLHPAASFLLHGAQVDRPTLIEPPPWLVVLNRFPFPAWLVLFAVVAGLCLGPGLVAHVFAPSWQWPATIGATLFVLLGLLLL